MSNLTLSVTAQIIEMASAEDNWSERVNAMRIGDAETFRKVVATPEMHGFLRDRMSVLPQLDVVSLVAENGDVVNFTRSFPVPKIKLSD